MYVNSNWIDAQKGSPRAWVSVCVGGEEGRVELLLPPVKPWDLLNRAYLIKGSPHAWVSVCGGGGGWNSYSTRKTLRFIKRSSELPIFVEYASSECYSI